jgi:hypothetical protein
MPQQSGRFDTLVDHFQTLRHLRMVRTGIVQQISDIIQKPGFIHGLASLVSKTAIRSFAERI